MDLISSKKQADVRLHVPESQKDKEWHKRYAAQLLATSQFDTSKYTEIEYAYNYLQGRIDPLKDHSFLMVSDSGKIYPVDFLSMNEIVGHVELLVNQQTADNIHIGVDAISKGALARKNTALEYMKVDYNLLQLYAHDQNEFGFQMIGPETPVTQQDLDKKIKNYKEQGELFLHRLLEQWKKDNNFAAMRKELFQDILVSGFIGLGSEVTKHGVRPEHYDCRHILWDGAMTDPYGADARMMAVVKYIPVSMAMDLYHIDKKDLDDLLNNNKHNTVSIGSGQNSTFPIQMSMGGEQRVLYSKVQWKDVKKKVGLHYISKNGRHHYHIRNEEIDPDDWKRGIDTPKKREKAVEKTEMDVEITRECITLGNELVLNYGPLENMVRRPDEWRKSQGNIRVYVPGLKHGKSVSLVQRLIPLQKLKDRCWYQLQKAFKKDRGLFFLNDQAQRPGNMDAKQQMYLAEMLGGMDINTKKLGVPSNYNQFQTVDLSLSPNVRIYVDIASMITEEMERQSGVSPLRQGLQPQTSTAVGVANMSKTQSQLRTEGWFSGFYTFLEEYLSLVVNQLKLHATYMPSRYAHIIADEGLAHMFDTEMLAMEHYGVNITTRRVSEQDKQFINEMTIKAVHQNQLPYLEGIEVLLENDPFEAKDRLEKAFEERDAAQREMRQQEQMIPLQQQEMERQAKSEEHGMEMQKIQAKGHADFQRAQLAEKNKADIEHQKSMNDRMKMLFQYQIDKDRLQREIENQNKERQSGKKENKKSQ